jgi:hypothetical protein
MHSTKWNDLGAVCKKLDNDQFGRNMNVELYMTNMMLCENNGVRKHRRSGRLKHKVMLQ